MKYSKEQLIEMVRPYFKDDKVKLLYVTEDNQVFYPNKKVDAFSHARVYKLAAPFEISKDDLKVKSVENKEEDPDKLDLIEYAEALGINVDKRMGKKKLEQLIKEKEDARE